MNLGKDHRTESKIIHYAKDHSVKLIPAQLKLIEETKKVPRGRMMGAADELHLLSNLCQLIKARKTLDIGTFTGYSALTIALTLPEGGKVITCDTNDTHLNLGKRFWKEAKVENKIDVKIAPATETLQCLIDNGESGTFDFAFIDADKANYDNYYEQCLKLVHSGGIIAIDNVLWGGKVVDEAENDAETAAIRKLNDKIHKDERVNVSMLTIGDGTSLVFVK